MNLGLTLGLGSRSSGIVALTPTQIEAFNLSRLESAKATYGTTLTSDVFDVGDSLIENAQGTARGDSTVLNEFATDAHYSGTYVISKHMTGVTFRNFAVGGTRSDQILAAFAARAASLQDDHGTVSMQTNDLGQQTNGNSASGVVSATITAAGSGGTNGTYVIPTTGGTGSPLTQASYSVVVSGGAITSATPISIGGGFRVAPTFDLSSIPGLTGATLTANLDPYVSITSNMTAFMTLAGARRIVMPGWVATGAPASNIYGMSRRILAWAKTQSFGNRVLDALQLFARSHDGSAPEIAQLQTGVIPTRLMADTTHNNDAGIKLLGDLRTQMHAAQQGLHAPFTHSDDIFPVKPGAAENAVIGALRVIGTPDSMRERSGNVSKATKLSGTSILRATGTPVHCEEVQVEAVSNTRGRGNVARAILMRSQDGTAPRPINISGNGGSWLASSGLTGVGNVRKMTVVVTARLRGNPANNTIASVLTGTNKNIGSPFITQPGTGMRLRPHNSSGTATGLVTATAGTPTNWNTYFFEFNSEAGAEKIRAVINNGSTVNGTAPATNAEMALGNPIYLFTASGTALVDADIEQIVIYADALDITNQTNRETFFTPATGRAKDIGNGVVGGLTPVLFINGDVYEWFTGANRGSGGPLSAPPFIDTANLGFREVV